MRIDTVQTSHTGLIDVGKYSCFVNFKKDGSDLTVDTLIDYLKGHSHLVMTGDVISFKDEFKDIIKKIIKTYPYMTFDIVTDGTEKFVFLNYDYGTIMFYVYVGTDLKKDVLEWYNLTGAKFIFNVDGVDEVDSKIILMNEYSLDKKRCYITTTNGETLNDIMFYCLSKGLNCCPNFREMMWGEL